MRVLTGILFFLMAMPSLPLAAAATSEETYLKTDDYITAALGEKPEKPGILWVSVDMRPTLKKILQRKAFPLRYRYWRKGPRTVWIINEIGKVLPITTGLTIEQGKIIDLTVLTYRESHGSEIRFPAYSNQFTGASLTDKLRLSKPINGISGATLSTNAMKKVSRLALYLHKNLLEENVPSPTK